MYQGKYQRNTGKFYWKSVLPTVSCEKFGTTSVGYPSLLYAHFMHVANGFISTEMTQDCIKLHLYYHVVPCHLEDTALDDYVIIRWSYKFDKEAAQ